MTSDNESPGKECVNDYNEQIDWIQKELDCDPVNLDALQTLMNNYTTPQELRLSVWKLILEIEPCDKNYKTQYKADADFAFSSSIYNLIKCEKTVDYYINTGIFSPKDKRDPLMKITKSLCSTNKGEHFYIMWSLKSDKYREIVNEAQKYHNRHMKVVAKRVVELFPIFSPFDTFSISCGIYDRITNPEVSSQITEATMDGFRSLEDISPDLYTHLMGIRNIEEFVSDYSTSIFALFLTPTGFASILDKVLIGKYVIMFYLVRSLFFQSKIILLNTNMTHSIIFNFESLPSEVRDEIVEDVMYTFYDEQVDRSLS